MIKINRCEKPKELTEECEKRLTDEFKKDCKKSVWNQEYIKKALMTMSNSKCCYCETKLQEDSKDLHIDHFKPKSLYPEDVIRWENLLPSCLACNRKKNDHNVVENQIINPVDMNPKDYLYFYKFRYESIADNKIGRATIECLELNRTSCGNITTKFSICITALNTLDSIYDNAIEAIEANSGKKIKLLKKQKGNFEDVLMLAKPDKHFSACMATSIVEWIKYDRLKDIFITNGLWDDELISLDKMIHEISLPKPI